VRNAQRDGKDEWDALNGENLEFKDNGEGVGRREMKPSLRNTALQILENTKSERREGRTVPFVFTVSNLITTDSRRNSNPQSPDSKILQTQRTPGYGGIQIHSHQFVRSRILSEVQQKALPLSEVVRGRRE
jgi:hypothetical protein